MGRNSQPTPGAPRPGTSFSADNKEPVTTKGAGSSQHKLDSTLDLSSKSKFGRIFASVLLIAIALLLAGVLGVTMTSDDKNESNLVATDRYQAVFLTNDQVYFGKVTAVNGKYLVLNHIYYLQSSNGSSQNQNTSNTNVSLVKLGCELHKPFDQMVINRSQVQFWENLQSDGQVGTAIKQFEQQNPGGQKCSTPTTGTSTNVQGSTENNANTNNATTENSTNNSSNTTDKKTNQ